MSRTYSSRSVYDASCVIEEIAKEKAAILAAIETALRASKHTTHNDIVDAMDRFDDVLDEVFWNAKHDATDILDRDAYEEGDEYDRQVESYYQETRI